MCTPYTPLRIHYNLKTPIIVTASYDRQQKIRVWAEGEKTIDIREFRELDKKTELVSNFNYFDSQVNSLALHKNWLAVAGFNSIKIFDISNNEKEVCSYSHDDDPELSNNPMRSNRHQKFSKIGYRNEMKVIFSNDGNSLFSCNERGVITWFSFICSKLTIHQQISVSKIVTSIAVYQNQKMAIITKTGEIYFWTLNDSCIPFPFTHVSDSLISVDFSEDGNYLAVMNSKGNVWVWNEFSPKSKPIKSFNFIEKAGKFQITQYALKLKFSPDSKLLTIIGSHGNIKVYDVFYDFVLQVNHAVSTSKVVSGPWIWDLTYSSNSEYLYFGASDGYTRKWKIGENKYELIFYPILSSKAISAIAVYAKEF